MGNLIHKKGDFTQSDCVILAHCCNCRNGFGSGVAGLISKLYPKAKEYYHLKYKNSGWRLGDIQIVVCDSNRIIVNMAMQDTYGRVGVHINYPSIKTCFEKLLVYAESLNCNVAIPRVGSGLAGGDWKRIETIIAAVVKDYTVNIECYEYENEKLQNFGA